MYVNKAQNLADDDVSHLLHHPHAAVAGEQHGHHGDHRGQGGHQDGPQPGGARLDQRFLQGHGLSELVGAVHQIDAVIDSDAEEHQKTHQAQHAHGGAGEEHHAEGAHQAEWDGGHNHEGELRGLELRGHNHKDQEYRYRDRIVQSRELLLHHTVSGVGAAGNGSGQVRADDFVINLCLHSRAGTAVYIVCGNGDLVGLILLLNGRRAVLIVDLCHIRQSHIAAGRFL